MQPYTYTKTQTNTALTTVVSLGLMVSISVISIASTAGLLAAAFILPQTDQKINCSNVRADSAVFMEKNIAAKTENIKTSLDSAYANYSLSKSKKSKTVLSQVIQDRKKFFLENIRNNPRSAIFSLLPPHERQKLKQISSNCIEEETQVEGKLQILHTDDFVREKGSYEYSLVTKDKRKIALHSVNGFGAAHLSGTQVVIKGYLIDNEMLFDGSNDFDSHKSPLGGMKILSIPKNPPVKGEQKFLVLLADFLDAKESVLTSDTVREALFTNAFAFYDENSFGKITSFTGDTLGWRTLPINKTCNSNAILQETIKLFDPQVDFNNYSRLVIVVPTNFESAGSCGAGGVGTIDKIDIDTQDGVVQMSVSWIHVAYNISSFIHVIEHELGHNFGNGHASFYDCYNEAYLDYFENGCAIREYSDPYDVMGYGPGHFNALHKEVPEWFDAENIKIVTESNTYTIEPIEIKTSNLQALKLQRNPDDYLFIEYRQPIGFDSSILENIHEDVDVFKGALIHSNAIPDFGGRGTSWLIDPTPPGSPYTSALKVGDVFIDPLNGAQIKTVSQNNSSLTLQIHIGKTDFILPTINILNPLQDFQRVSGDVTISAQAFDDSGIEKVEFTVFGFKDEETLTLLREPYEAVFDSRLWGNGDNYINVRAYDRSGEAFGIKNNSNSVARAVWVQNTDPEPPSVRLLLPQENITYRNPIRVSAEASDNIEVYRVDFYANNNVVYSDYSSPYEGDISLPTGDYTIRAFAYDNVRNGVFSQESSLIHVMNDPPSVKIIRPVDGEVIFETSPMVAEAKDDSRIKYVEFYQDDQNYAQYYDDTQEDGFFMDNIYTRNLSDGPHTFWARAYDDAEVFTDSKTVHVAVDNRPIAVQIESPEDNAIVSGDSAINVTIQGPIDKVEYYYRGVQTGFLGLNKVSPYGIVWDTTKVPDGDYTIWAIVWGKRGNIEYSQEVVLHIQNKRFLRGDVNNDGKIDISDPVRLLDYLFKAGNDISCQDSADANDDGELDISDAIIILLYLSDSEKVPTLPAPFDASGVDPTADNLTCNL